VRVEAAGRWSCAGRPARLLPVLLAAVLLPGCAARTFVQPAGPATPLADASAAWDAATQDCRAIRTYHQELRLSARIDGRGFPAVTVGLALDDTEQIGLGAFAMGQPLFRLGGTSDRAVLWLREGNRVVTGQAAAMVEALVGVGLGPERLLAIVSGCITRADAERAERVGELVRVFAGDTTVYLEAVDGGWRPRAGLFDRLVVDYQRYDAALPRRILIRSETGREPAVALTLQVEGELRLNPALDAGQVFTVQVPAGAVPASMEALRAAGPLGDAVSGR
jgi:outer membrane biogenesis lipoprotein LolB